jgi:hypothetical protein
MNKRGKPPILDAVKRETIATLLSMGCSQSMAADYIGCAVTTIQRTADRDPAFAAMLNKAKCHAELGLIRNIRNAAAKEQYWRAAAWALERFFPDKYGQRAPDLITREQLSQILARFADAIVQNIPVEKYRKNVIHALEIIVRECGGTTRLTITHKTEAPLPPKMPTGSELAVGVDLPPDSLVLDVVPRKD